MHDVRFVAVFSEGSLRSECFVKLLLSRVSLSSVATLEANPTLEIVDQLSSRSAEGQYQSSTTRAVIRKQRSQQKQRR